MARPFHLKFVALGLLSISGTKGNDGVNRFTYPTESLTFNYLDTVQVAYKGNISKPLMYTWCRNAAGDVVQKLLDHTGDFNSTAPIQLDFTVDTEVANCWFNIRLDQPGSAVGANSPGFKFNSTEGDQKTFSLASATSTTSTTSTTPASTQSGVSTNPTASSTPAPTPAPSPSPNQNSSAHSGLSTGAQAGIGIGAGLVGIAIGAAAAAMVYRLRNKRGDGPGDNAFSGSSQYRPTTGSPPVLNSSLYQEAGYYAQVPIREAQFQDSSKPGQTFVAYDGSIPQGQDAQKFRGAPFGLRHEMDGSSASNVHEMP
ncbi:hypothetical protein F5Y06DRAFT_267985 [Hypoxylon sp. FL0890]|nr:hypothetical protein F5Y06DRAFT_267985 [Hypoxylon sp. FL0890]